MDMPWLLRVLRELVQTTVTTQPAPLPPPPPPPPPPQEMALTWARAAIGEIGSGALARLAAFVGPEIAYSGVVGGIVWLFLVILYARTLFIAAQAAFAVLKAAWGALRELWAASGGLVRGAVAGLAAVVLHMAVTSLTAYVFPGPTAWISAKASGFRESGEL